MCRLRYFVPCVAALVLLAAGCGGYGDSKESAGSEGETTAMDVAGKSSADVELDDYYFDPAVLEGDSGQKITLELENEGKVEHNFSITSQGIDQDVEADEKTEVTVTLPQSGTLAFFCKYHKSQGMSGTLQVGGAGSGGGMETGTTQTGSGY
jgi:plastocyanin